jgi:hypothetical protein
MYDPGILIVGVWGVEIVPPLFCGAFAIEMVVYEPDRFQRICPLCLHLGEGFVPYIEAIALNVVVTLGKDRAVNLAVSDRVLRVCGMSRAAKAKESNPGQKTFLIFVPCQFQERPSFI